MYRMVLGSGVQKNRKQPVVLFVFLHQLHSIATFAGETIQLINNG